MKMNTVSDFKELTIKGWEIGKQTIKAQKFTIVNSLSKQSLTTHYLPSARERSEQQTNRATIHISALSELTLSWAERDNNNEQQVYVKC